MRPWLGHQGEDIRPSVCKLRNDGADRCEPYQDQVVAVGDGIIWRVAGDEALYLIADAPNEHVRFRYLHMNPHMLDFDGMVSGRALTEGEVLGPVGDYGTREGGTSYHLHFDMQVPTRRGWLFVNPCMTLVAAYERLIGGRGQSPPPRQSSRQVVSCRPPSGPIEPNRKAGKSEPKVNANNRSARSSPNIARRGSLKVIAGMFAGLMLPRQAFAAAGRMPFDQWIDAFRAKALAHGITAETYTRS